MIFELPLLVLLVMTAAGAILVKDLVSAVFILGSYSFALALVWALVGAVDVAFVEAVVGAGLATVFFLLTLFRTGEKDTRIRRLPVPKIALVGLPLLALLMLYGDRTRGHRDLARRRRGARHGHRGRALDEPAPLDPHLLHRARDLPDPPPGRGPQPPAGVVGAVSTATGGIFAASRCAARW